MKIKFTHTIHDDYTHRELSEILHEQLAKDPNYHLTEDELYELIRQKSSYYSFQEVELKCSIDLDTGDIDILGFSN